MVQVEFDDFANGVPGATTPTIARGVPVRRIATASGEVLVTTGFDLIMAQCGVGRGLEGAYPSSYDDADAPFTPAWQERYTGIGRETAIRFAREFARNAELTNGKSMVIVGASANHWYYNNLIYRTAIQALILCGCCGVNGGGMNHYVGQEKLAPHAPWGTIAFARDWVKPPRLVQSPTWHYANSCQWRYEAEFTEYGLTSPKPRWAKGHAMDLEAKSVRMGWMPMAPHFNRNPLDIVAEAERAGAKTEQRDRWARRRAAQEQEAALCGRRSRCRGELAAGVVHLARQRHPVERQGGGVLLAPLPRDARQRHRRRSRQGQDEDGAVPRTGAARKV